MIISIIVAVANNNVIGNKGKLPWHLPADLKHFQELTMGKAVIMGDRTFQSIGKPLPGRKNIVLSKDPNYKVAGCIVVHSIKEALNLVGEKEEVMIGGGASVYRQFLPIADKMYLTLIHADFTGDAFFPKYKIEDWKEIERIDHSPDRDNPYPYSFVTLERKYYNEK